MNDLKKSADRTLRASGTAAGRGVNGDGGEQDARGPHVLGCGAEAEQLQAEREATSGRAQPTWAPGSMEWQAEQEKLKAEREKLAGGGPGG